jgi:hypothetical protein
MIIESLIVLASALTSMRACPINATSALPELTGAWQVLMISGLDRTRPDSARAVATIAPDLQGCLLREQLHAQTGNPPYEAVIVWGVNGADSTIQRIFAHSQHGRIGVYQGRRVGSAIALRQQSLSTQPDGEVVENQVLISNRDHFTITSRLSEDHGRTWKLLSRWEYQRTSP